MRRLNSLKPIKSDCPLLVNNDGYKVTPETSGVNLRTNTEISDIDSNTHNTQNIKSMSMVKVKKVSQKFEDSRCEISRDFKGLIQDKPTKISSFKSANFRQDSTVDMKEKAVVRSPNQGKEKLSRTHSFKKERKKNVKELRKELELSSLGSSKPITDFFRRVELVSDPKQDGKSKTKYLKNEVRKSFEGGESD